MKDPLEKHHPDYVSHKVENHIKINPGDISVVQRVCSLTNGKKATVYYKGEPVGFLYKSNQGRWYKKGSEKFTYDDPRYPADLVVRGFLRNNKPR